MLFTIAGTTAGGAGGQTTGLVTVSSDATSISGKQSEILAAHLANTPAASTTAAHIAGLNGLAVISGDDAGNALTY